MSSDSERSSGACSFAARRSVKITLHNHKLKNMLMLKSDKNTKTLKSIDNYNLFC